MSKRSRSGWPKGTDVEVIAPRREQPLVFYGTSIMQGASASRPGMSITGILQKRLNRPVINLGFSGNGMMEAEVGMLLGELDAAIYVIDCLPNMEAVAVAERTEPFVRMLRDARPKTPILLVEDRTYTYSRYRKSARERHASGRAALGDALNSLAKAGVGNVHCLGGDKLIGDDGGATTDGSHPSDIGMVRYADAYESALRTIAGLVSVSAPTASGLDLKRFDRSSPYSLIVSCALQFFRTVWANSQPTTRNLTSITEPSFGCSDPPHYSLMRLLICFEFALFGSMRFQRLLPG